MGEASDIELLLKAHKAVQRGTWLKPLLAAAVSIVGSVGGTAWTVRGYIDKLEHVIEGQQLQLHDLQERVKGFDQVREIAFAARAEADLTAAKLDGHLRPDVQTRVR